MFARLILCLPIVLLFASTMTSLAIAAAADDVAGSAPAMARESDKPKPHVDEVALRYYASLKQKGRVDAEIRRLQRLHPDWKPPADLWTLKPGNPDDSRLWDLFAADRLDDLRAAIAAHRAEDAGWVLSPDLAQKLRRKELRVRILASARAKRWSDVAGLIGNWRSDVEADDLEALWLVAEAYARIGRVPESSEIMEAALRSAAGAKERIATVQKALGFLPMGDAERLLQLGKRDASGRNEFDAIAVDITRARISAFLRDQPGGDISAAEVARFQDFAASAPDANQTALLGWYSLKHSDPQAALEYFKSAIAKGGNESVAFGLALTLRRLGRLRDAEEVSYAWREPSLANMTLFLDVVADELMQRTPFDARRLSRYADVTLQTTSGEAAEALGWYAYNSCQTEAASEWFKRAVAWLPKETTVLGYALALRRLKRNEEFVEVVNRYDGLFPSVIGLLFPDGASQGDDVCSPRSAKSDAAKVGGLSPDRRGLQSLAMQAQVQRVAWSSVPMPDRMDQANAERNIVGRSGFPAAVVLENPYRVPPQSRSPGASASGGWRPADAYAPVSDARRVPGVGAMPYERLGRGLLPAWNGTQQPSASSDLLRAPAGTQWALDQASADASGQSARSAGGHAFNASSPAGETAANRFHP